MGFAQQREFGLSFSLKCLDANIILKRTCTCFTLKLKLKGKKSLNLHFWKQTKEAAHPLNLCWCVSFIHCIRHVTEVLIEFAYFCNGSCGEMPAWNWMLTCTVGPWNWVSTHWVVCQLKGNYYYYFNFLLTLFRTFHAYSMSPCSLDGKATIRAKKGSCALFEAHIYMCSVVLISGRCFEPVCRITSISRHYMPTATDHQYWWAVGGVKMKYVDE